MKSESIGDYLKTIYLIQEEQNGSPASTTSLASRLGISNASVTGMLKHLALTQPELIDYKPYYGVTLSPAGLKNALEIIRHHRLIESYLNEKLGYSWDEVHAEAERLEHVISEEMEERLATALGHPKIDPHGDPIPDREGNVIKPDYSPLTTMLKGQQAEIRRIGGQEPEFLRYLSGHGLFLTTRIQIENKDPFNGPISIHIVGSSEPTLVVGWDVAAKILVRPVSNSFGGNE